MSEGTRQKFDGYANLYDEWFMKNENLFTSELRLFKKVLGDISGKKLLSVGCGSGLFESYIDSSNIEGIEPSKDMGQIAEKRGVNVIKYGMIEDVDLPDENYDIIYFNGSSSYMEDLKPVYEKSLKALKAGGKLILLDVPKESAFGFMYLLGKSLGTYEHEYLEGTMPALPYPLGLASSGVWHSTEEKIGVLKGLGVERFSFYQTLIKNPLYTNEEPEEVAEGYKSGGYVAIIAEK
ncbi:MAG: class I SAM-dependent methyltransferase [Lachnospiraceae bacterium]|nr:class I SAM-dependent methyltransferase [Lachnospiraceae bacterium]